MPFTFDNLVGGLERRLLPELEAVAGRLRGRYPGVEAEPFSRRLVPDVHSLGIATGPLPVGLIVNAFGISRLSVRGFVTWDKTYRRNATTSVHYDEAMT